MLEVIKKLEEKKVALAERQIAIKQERNELALDALSGNTEAEAQLDKITSESVRIDLDVENIDMAIKTAEAKHAAALEQTRIDGLNVQVKAIQDDHKEIAELVAKAVLLESTLYKTAEKVAQLVRKHSKVSRPGSMFGVSNNAFQRERNNVERGHATTTSKMMRDAIPQLQGEIGYLATQGAEMVVLERLNLDKTRAQVIHENTCATITKEAKQYVKPTPEQDATIGDDGKIEESTVDAAIEEAHQVASRVKPIAEIRAEMAAKEAVKTTLSDEEQALLDNLA